MTLKTSPFHPPFPLPPTSEPAPSQSLISHLNLQPHPEGGYFTETDRDARVVANPFSTSNVGDVMGDAGKGTRNASTTIFYLLSPMRWYGSFHRNKARTVHTLHKGRGRYVLLHVGKTGERAEVQTFVVGQDVDKGEKLQWIVEGGVWKASFLLPDADADETGEGEGMGSKEGCLISETVVPGFEFEDHEFLTEKAFKGLLSEEIRAELGWLVRRE